MKAIDLKIGDLIKWGDDYYRVTLVDDENNISVQDLDGIKDYAYVHGIEPIQLTEEILKANGAHWNKDFDVWTDGHHFSFAKDLHFGRVYNMDDDYHHEVMMPFKYVQELQHALRLCELNDLADNFKLTTA